MNVIIAGITSGWDHDRDVSLVTYRIEYKNGDTFYEVATYDDNAMCCWIPANGEKSSHLFSLISKMGDIEDEYNYYSYLINKIKGGASRELNF